MKRVIRSKRTTGLVGAATAALGLALLLPGHAGAAAPPEPSYATATVDGSAAEWAPGDVWGTILTNDPPHRVVASASLRYDCDTSVLYVLVTAAPGETFMTTDPEEAYVRLGPTGKLVSGLSGNDGTAPDFEWISPSGGTAQGFEASAPLDPGSYPASLRIHGQLPDDSEDGYETIDLTPRYSDLSITCVEAVTSTTAFPTTTTDPSTTIPTTTIPTTTGPSTSVAAVTVASTPTDPPAAARTELARTGAPTGKLTVVATILILAGSVLVLRSRELRRSNA